MSLPPPEDLRGKPLELEGGAPDPDEELTDAEALERMREDLRRWDGRRELHTFKNPDYRREALAVAPLWLWRQTPKANIEFFKHVTTYDPEAETLVMKIYDGLFNGVISYKRRRFGRGKWVTCKGTHPNRKTLIRDRLDISPLWIVEGHHDGLTAILLDVDRIQSFNFIMVPTASYPAFTPEELEHLAGRDVFFLPDIGDKDETGLKCMRRLAKQAADTARNCKLVNLAGFLEYTGKKPEGEKLDLSDAVAHFDNLEEFTGTLHYYADRGVRYSGKEAF